MLKFEFLEPRNLMAGNVAAAIIGGELRVTGDNTANWVQIRQIAGADGTGRTFVIDGKDFNGELDAQGEPIAGNLSTRINGGLQDVVLKTPLDKVRIVMGGGNDALELGTGNEDLTAAGIVLETGLGHDFARLERIAMYGTDNPMVVSTGPVEETAGDTLVLDNVNVSAQSLKVSTGGGNDRVFAQLVTVSGKTIVDLGNGADSFDGESLNLQATTIKAIGSNDRDVITLAESDFLSLDVFLGGGDDLLDLRGRIKVTNRLTVNGGAGMDELGFSEFVQLGELVEISVERNT